MARDIHQDKGTDAETTGHDKNIMPSLQHSLKRHKNNISFSAKNK